MDLFIAFVIFLAAMAVCLSTGITVTLALLAGLVVFWATGRHRGYKSKELAAMCREGVNTSLVVVEIMFLIGILTALWRAGGTIAYVVYYGISVITPHLFIIIAFLLCLVLSFAIGTSFGVVGTAGVMLMVLARSGGVDEIAAAGAIISGSYFGDRASPISSSAVLVAACSKTDLYRNVKTMLKTGALPTMACILIYGILSYRHPISDVNPDVIKALEESFRISWITLIPALLVLVLPILKVNIKITMMSSIAASFLITVFLQKMPVTDTFIACVTGYSAQSEALKGVLSGGGIVSMAEVIAIIVISSTYSGIFNGTHMLDSVQGRIAAAADKIGLFPAQVIMSFFTAGLFCNQTIGTMLNAQLLSGVYEKKGAVSEELAMDLENSIIIIAGLIPWSVAAAVPLSMLGVGSKALLYSCFLYMVPLCYLFTKRIWYPKSGGTFFCGLASKNRKDGQESDD